MAVPPITQQFLQTVTVSALEYPLYDHFLNPVKCYFALGPKAIWDAAVLDEHEQPSVFPAAILRPTPFSVTLSTAGIALLGTLTPPFTLTAKLGQDDVFNVSLAAPNPLGEITDLTLLQPKAGGQLKSLPWMLHGEFEWTLKGSKNDQPSYTYDTSVEIYVLPSELPLFFQHSGIPLALLRYNCFLSTWMRTVETPPGKPAVNWPSFAVQQMFSNPLMEYETYSGSCKYTSWPLGKQLRQIFQAQEGISCWLDLWLSDMHGVTLDGITHAVNCYDLAALCQVVVSLGLSRTRNMRMQYMSPFGFINPTHLIGRVENPPNPSNPNNVCNNPFYMTGNNKYSKEMLVDKMSPLRSCFRNHMFLSYQKAVTHSVLDACCGPQLGDLLLEDYPKEVIDQNPTRYKPPDAPGEVKDMISGPGVNELVVSRCFERQGKPDPKSLALLDRLAVEMGSEGSWAQPYLTAPSGNWQISATWTFRPNNAQNNEIYTVHVYIYDGQNSTEIEYKKRMNLTIGWDDPVVGYDTFNDTGTGSIRIFADLNRFYIATIDARLGKAASTAAFKDKLQEVLETALTIPRPNNPSFLKGIYGPPGPVKVGDTVTITVQVSLIRA